MHTCIINGNLSTTYSCFILHDVRHDLKVKCIRTLWRLYWKMKYDLRMKWLHVPLHTYWITLPMFKNWFAHGINYRAIDVCSVRQIHHWLSEILKYIFGYSINVLPGIVISLGYCYNELLIHDPLRLRLISPYCILYYFIHSLD